MLSRYSEWEERHCSRVGSPACRGPVTWTVPLPRHETRSGVNMSRIDQDQNPETILVTGGAGFIGTNFILHWLSQGFGRVINLDKLTYAGNPNNLSHVPEPRHSLIVGDVCNRELVAKVLTTHRPRAVIHFAAETHVDRSIHSPLDFVRTNVDGTLNLLEACRLHWITLDSRERSAFRFVHVSTDEVYGSLSPNEPPSSEYSRYAPSSPYSASKAAADHLVRAWWTTYGLPTITLNCSNNYGPFQFPEKLIPLMILRALDCQTLPVYGDGSHVRDWLFVTDYCRAIDLALQHAGAGSYYNVGGRCEKTNVQVVQTICEILDREQPRSDGNSYDRQLTFVSDRPGHDRRYAIDFSKIERDLAWRPEYSFQTGIEQTVRWYLNNKKWVTEVTSGAYLQWIDKNYLMR
jgi:dTDP-glucose 4,6-dehydratase